MITAVDSKVLLDFLSHDSQFGVASRNTLRSAAGQGRLVVCDVVWAEIAGCFPSIAVFHETLEGLHLEFSPILAEAAFEAGVVWKTYRAAGGPRTRVVADFLIGAHALFQAERLLTRDRGFYRSCFKHLEILDPTKAR